MAQLRKAIETCIRLSGVLREHNVDRYLSALSDSNDNNIGVFIKFAGNASSAMLAALFRMGHFTGYDELLRIAGEIIEARQIFRDIEEEDVAGNIAFLLLHHRRKILLTLENGKFFFDFFIIIN